MRDRVDVPAAIKNMADAIPEQTERWVERSGARKAENRQRPSSKRKKAGQIIPLRSRQPQLPDNDRQIGAGSGTVQDNRQLDPQPSSDAYELYDITSLFGRDKQASSSLVEGKEDLIEFLESIAMN